jgi:hypothetical protein
VIGEVGTELTVGEAATVAELAVELAPKAEDMFWEKIMHTEAIANNKASMNIKIGLFVLSCSLLVFSPLKMVFMFTSLFSIIIVFNYLIYYVNL